MLILPRLARESGVNADTLSRLNRSDKIKAQEAIPATFVIPSPNRAWSRPSRLCNGSRGCGGAER
jgi:hypothetical protein